MFTSLYQEYLYLIGKLKDVHGLDIDVRHKDVHVFFKNKKPLFQLMYGTFAEEPDPSIVVSFHLELFHAEAIQWFIYIYNLHPLVRLNDSYIEDDKGDYFIGADAIKLQEVYRAQDVLSEWLDNKTREEIEDFAESEIFGYDEDPDDPKKVFTSQKQMDEAVTEFNRMKKPGSDDDVH